MSTADDHPIDVRVTAGAIDLAACDECPYKPTLLTPQQARALALELLELAEQLDRQYATPEDPPT